MIQETPKASEKLYILDSIDVPLSELNKYRHLSVVNKLPENIILPPPPPLRHESSAVASDANVITEPAVKPTIIVESPQHISNSTHVQHVKNDFEANVNYDEADLVETKNISIIQHVKKIIKKYHKGKRRERLTNIRTKSSTKNSNPNNPHITNEHSQDLSTPLRSLSPAHGFDVEMPSAVDLSVNSKEIIDEFEFIDSLSICSDDSEAGYGLMASPLTEYLELTEPQALHASAKNNETDEKSEKIPNSNENCDKTNESNEKIQDEARSEQKEKESESEVEREEEMEKDTETEKLENRNECEASEKKKISDECESNYEVSIETLRNICISTFNSEKFRSYFTENVINAPVDTADVIPSTSNEPYNCMEEAECQNAELLKTNDDAVECTVRPNEESKIQIIESITLPPHPVASSHVPSLRRLAINAILANQCCMSRNLKPFKSALEAEIERKLIESSNTDASPYKVRTLQELAREVAVTIYSFNVKPLQDICRLAIDRFNHLYLMNVMTRIEPSNVAAVPECSVSMENMSSLHGIYCSLFCYKQTFSFQCFQEFFYLFNFLQLLKLNEPFAGKINQL